MMNVVDTIINLLLFVDPGFTKLCRNREIKLELDWPWDRFNMCHSVSIRVQKNSRRAVFNLRSGLTVEIGT